MTNMKPVDTKQHKLSDFGREALCVADVIDGFIDFDYQSLQDFRTRNGIELDTDYLCFLRDFFGSEERNPTVEELSLLDMVWRTCNGAGTLFSEIGIDVQDKSFRPTVEKALLDYYRVRKKQWVDRKEEQTLNFLMQLHRDEGESFPFVTSVSFDGAFHLRALRCPPGKPSVGDRLYVVGEGSVPSDACFLRPLERGNEVVDLTRIFESADIDVAAIPDTDAPVLFASPREQKFPAVGRVTDTGRIRLFNGETPTADLDWSFLHTRGPGRHYEVYLTQPSRVFPVVEPPSPIRFGDGMVTVTGCCPQILHNSPLHGGVYTVLLALSGAVASGADPDRVQLDTALQGKPTDIPFFVAVILGIKEAEWATGLHTALRRTAVSEETEAGVTVFATALADRPVPSTANGHPVHFPIPRDEDDFPDIAAAMRQYRHIHREIIAGHLVAARVCDGENDTTPGDIIAEQCIRSLS